VAAVAERRPRRRPRAADAAAADRRILDLGPQLADDALGRGLLERRRLLDRHARDAGVLEREPAEDRRLARRLLSLLEPGGDDAIAELALLDRDVRRERRANEIRVGIRPRQAGEDTDVAALVEAEAARAAGDLRNLPRLEVAPLLAVELRRLGEEERLARQID